MRILTILLLAGILAGRTDDKTVELTLLPKAEKGQEEKIELEASFAHVEGDSPVTDVVTGTLKRKIKAVGDDGLASREQLTLETAKFRKETRMAGGGKRSSNRALPHSWSETRDPEGKRRRATIAPPPPDFPPAPPTVL